MLVSEAFEMYRLEYIVYRNQSQRTEEMHRLALKSLISFAGDMPISDLTFDMVRKWKDHMSKTKSANTTRGYIIKLRVVLAHIRLQGYTALNPELVGIPKRKTTVVEFITPTEVQYLIDCIFKPQSGYSTLNRYRNRAIVALLYSSGIRVGELCDLNKLSIREDSTFTVVGKGDKSRLCFVDTRAMSAIKEYLAIRNDNADALFICEKTGKRITKGVVQMVFRYAREKAGFEKDIHPHTLRHSFATNLLHNNTNLLYVRDFLGHSSVQTTEMYTHVVNEDLKRIYAEKHSI